MCWNEFQPSKLFPKLMFCLRGVCFGDLENGFHGLRYIAHGCKILYLKIMPRKPHRAEESQDPGYFPP